MPGNGCRISVDADILHSNVNFFAWVNGICGVNITTGDRVKYYAAEKVYWYSKTYINQLSWDAA